MSFGKLIALGILASIVWHYYQPAHASLEPAAATSYAPAAESHDAYPDMADAKQRSYAMVTVSQFACTAAAMQSPMRVTVRSTHDAQLVNGWAKGCGYPVDVAVVQPDADRLDIQVQ